jgi:hypothetical protein
MSVERAMLMGAKALASEGAIRSLGVGTAMTEMQDEQQAVAYTTLAWPSMMKALAEARREEESARNATTEMQRLFENTAEYKAFLAARTALHEKQLAVAAIEAEVRKAAVEDFKFNGEKAVYAGVQVKLFTKVEYDAKAMRDWAKANMTSLLHLDTKAVELAAKSGVIDEAPITITKEPRAQIDSDLSAYLGEAH